MDEQPSRLRGQRLTLGYEGHEVCRDLTIDIPDGKFTVIVGPNGCGKSTLLKSLCRLLKPKAGTVFLDGKDIHTRPTRDVAKTLGLLPQSALVPEGIKVADLVARGRYPHQNTFRQWTEDDEQAVARAMAVTGVTELAHQMVDQLSGGQRQRVWIAMVLAQQTPVILLDEPTTYLDIAHQIDLLDLFRQLNRESGHTVIAVLHDLNHACRYADHLIAVKGGEVIAHGEPAALVTEDLIRQVFGLNSLIIDDPVSGTPMVIPKGS
nr:ABC transporter ATP-binding protein [Vibrio quintilis]